jgi:uncharacterized protein
MIDSQVLDAIKRDSILFGSTMHGLYHWRTVERNGLYLSQHVDCDVQVVSCFAYLHDCMRQNEGSDPNHGPRAAEYAARHQAALGLSDAQFELLAEACSTHTSGQVTDDTTVGVCWDADRLDLGRVGIMPEAQFLISAEAKRIAATGDYDVLFAYASVEKI